MAGAALSQETEDHRAGKTRDEHTNAGEVGGDGVMARQTIMHAP